MKRLLVVLALHRAVPTLESATLCVALRSRIPNRVRGTVSRCVIVRRVGLRSKIASLCTITVSACLAPFDDALEVTYFGVLGLRLSC